jgi:arylsulfatase A-like enzyme/Flp pilus assembly protein TadD
MSHRRARKPPTPAPSRRFSVRLWAGALGLVVLAAVGTWWFTRTPAFTLRSRADQNVLLVTIDTLRADALSCYGGRAQTPNLDALAAHGARFTFAHAQTVLTLPSHASILTGLYPYDHGIRDNSGYRLRAGEPTVATRLQPLGFATGAFVGAFPLNQRFGLNAGFQVYDDKVGEVGPSMDFALPARRADAVVASALGWIDRQPGKWFTWVHVFDPHQPYAPPPEWLARYPSDPYLGEVAWTDAALGPLFDRLATEPRSTLVIVTADHGESLGEHGELTHGLFAYEATLHVPLIITDVDPRAARRPRGVTIDAPVRHVDLLPTILEAVGAAPDPALPGSSLANLIARGTGPDRPSYFEAMSATLNRGWAPLRGVLVGHEKYIDLPIPELYNLADDPAEQRNLAAEEPDRLRVLANTLATFNTAPPGRPADESAAVLDRLRALGYVGGGGAAARDHYTEADDPKRLIQLDQLMHTASVDFESNRLDDAVKALRQVIGQRPGNADAYLDLSAMYWETGQSDEAIGALEDALKAGVAQRGVRVKLGLYLALTGQAGRAVRLLQDTAQDDPEALSALGIAYGQLGRDADAMRAFQHMLDLDPTSGVAYQNMGTLLLRENKNAGAETALRKAIAIDPTLSNAHTTLGVVLQRTGRLSDAIASWRQAVALDPTEYLALYNLTGALLSTGQRDDAVRFGRQFIDTAPPSLYGPQIAQIRQLIGQR